MLYFWFICLLLIHQFLKIIGRHHPDYSFGFLVFSFYCCTGLLQCYWRHRYRYSSFM